MRKKLILALMSVRMFFCELKKTCSDTCTSDIENMVDACCIGHKK